MPNVPPASPLALQAAITSVWASLYSRRALLARRAAGVPHTDACMCILIQRQLAPRLSFVLHTVHPLTQDASTLVAEVAPGMGELLASGTRGSAWRLAVPKHGGGKLEMLAFANFSKALMPVAGGASDDAASPFVKATSPKTSSGEGTATKVDTSGGSVDWQVVEYSDHEMSCSVDFRTALGARLAGIGAALEEELGGPQDVEGCVADGAVYVVQSRPQM